MSNNSSVDLGDKNPAEHGYSEVFYIYAIYSLMAVIGILGNLMTCLVITRNKSLHTGINCFLFSLAIADLVILIFCFPPYLLIPANTDLTCKLR